MEVRLTILLALTFTVLMLDAAVLWWLLRLLQQAGKHAQRNRADYARIHERLRTSLRIAEQATSRLRVVSGELRTAVVEFDDGSRRADNWARYGLAKLDFNAERLTDNLSARTRSLAHRIRNPLYRTAAAVHGLRATLDLIARWRDGGTGRLQRTAQLIDRVDTAANIVEAVTALGDLFSSQANNNGSRRR